MGQKSPHLRLHQLANGPFPAFAVRYARRLLDDDPDYGPGWIMLGIALTKLARYAEASQALAKAIDLCPPAKRQIPLAQMGHVFREAGDCEQAAAWYRRAIDADPTDASYRIYLGAVLAKHGHFRQAEEEHRAAISCPEGAIDEAYLNLGLVLRAQERFAEAADCFREAIRLDPEYREARRALLDVELCMKWIDGRR